VAAQAIDVDGRMTKTYRIARTAAVLSLALAGCLTAEPASSDTTQAASGAGGGGGGGGGVKPGRLAPASAAVTCDDGTTLGVNLSRGFQNRVEMQVVVTGSSGTASGFLEILLDDATTGAFVNGFGSWPASFVPGLSMTNLGSTVPVGVSTLDFSAVIHDGATAAGPALVVCTTSIVVVAN